MTSRNEAKARDLISRTLGPHSLYSDAAHWLESEQAIAAALEDAERRGRDYCPSHSEAIRDRPHILSCPQCYAIVQYGRHDRATEEGVIADAAALDEAERRGQGIRGEWYSKASVDAAYQRGYAEGLESGLMGEGNDVFRAEGHLCDAPERFCQHDMAATYQRGKREGAARRDLFMDQYTNMPPITTEHEAASRIAGVAVELAGFENFGFAAATKITRLIDKELDKSRRDGADWVRKALGQELNAAILEVFPRGGEDNG